MVITKFEDVFGETHESYGAYKFHIQKREASERMEAYVAAFRQLAKGCSFGKMQDRLILEHIAVGIKDDTVREKF